MEEQKKVDLETQTIVCPYCGSKNIVFLPEYHKSLARIFKVALIVCYVIYVLYTIPTADLLNLHKLLSMQSDGFKELFTVSFIFFMFLLLFDTTIYITERTTHVVCICKHCQRKWHFD